MPPLGALLKYMILAQIHLLLFWVTLGYPIYILKALVCPKEARKSLAKYMSTTPILSWYNRLKFWFWILNHKILLEEGIVWAIWYKFSGMGKVLYYNQSNGHLLFRVSQWLVLLKWRAFDPQDTKAMLLKALKCIPKKRGSWSLWIREFFVVGVVALVDRLMVCCCQAHTAPSDSRRYHHLSNRHHLFCYF